MALPISKRIISETFSKMKDKMIYPRTPFFNFQENLPTETLKAKDTNSLLNKLIVISEKLDGINLCMEYASCFDRNGNILSGKIYDGFKNNHASISGYLDKETQIFIEYTGIKNNCQYTKIGNHMNIIGIKNKKTGKWLSWNEMKNYASRFGYKTVPLIWLGEVKTEKELQDLVVKCAGNNSIYGNLTREGVVVRPFEEFFDITANVRKYVNPKFLREDEDFDPKIAIMKPKKVGLTADWAIPPLQNFTVNVAQPIDFIRMQLDAPVQRVNINPAALQNEDLVEEDDDAPF